MNILFLTPTLPYPPDAGGKIVIFNTIKCLSQKHNISLLSLIQPGQEKFISALHSYCKNVEVVEKKIEYHRPALLLNLFSPLPYTISKFFNEDLKKKLKKIIRENNFDLIQIEHLHMAQYIEWVEQRPVLLRQHNIEATMMLRFYQSASNWLEKFYALHQWYKLNRYEPHISRLFDACLFLSEQDAFSMKPLCNKIYVLPCGVDTEYFEPKPQMEKENKLIFVGNFNFKPTLDGLIYFLKNIMPLLKKEIPKLEIKIVGPYPEKKLKFWKNEKNLLFTGYVVDVRPYIWESTVEIIPLRIASGVRLKILEGMALGKPMVSTSIGCEGLEVIDNQHLFIADSPVEFAKKTVKLLESPDLRKKFSENSRRLVEQKYNWREIVKNLERIYLQLVESKWKLSS